MRATSPGVKSPAEMMEMRVEEPFIPIPRRWLAVLPADVCLLVSQLVYHAAKSKGSFAINYSSLASELCCSQCMLHKRLRWLNNKRMIDLTRKIDVKKGGRHFGSYTTCSFNAGNFELTLNHLPPKRPNRSRRLNDQAAPPPTQPKRSLRTDVTEKGALLKEGVVGVPTPPNKTRHEKSTKAIPQSSRTPIAVMALCGQDNDSLTKPLKFAAIDDGFDPTTPTTSRPHPANLEDDIIGLWPIAKLN